MTRHPAPIPAKRRRRQAVSLLAIVSLLVSTLMPLAHALAAPARAGALLAAICSPDGIRYVEIDLGAAGETPVEPVPAGLEHCPGCLAGSDPALAPGFAELVRLDAAPCLTPSPGGPPCALDSTSGFLPRAPPAAN